MHKDDACLLLIRVVVSYQDGLRAFLVGDVVADLIQGASVAETKMRDVIFDAEVAGALSRATSHVNIKSRELTSTDGL